MASLKFSQSLSVAKSWALLKWTLFYLMSNNQQHLSASTAIIMLFPKKIPTVV